jgi:hypothetical protein
MSPIAQPAKPQPDRKRTLGPLRGELSTQQICGGAGANEGRTLARLRTLRSDLIDPTIAVHHGRIVKRTGNG